MKKTCIGKTRKCAGAEIPHVRWLHSLLPLLLLIAMSFLALYGKLYGKDIQHFDMKKNLRIAVFIQADSNQFFEEMERGIREAAARHGIKAVVIANKVYQGSQEKNLFQSILETRPDAILIMPEARERSRQFTLPLIRHANQNKIPVVCIHASVDDDLLKAYGSHVDCFVASDKKNGGFLAGDYLARKLNGEGTVLVMEGGRDAQKSDSGRREGFLDALGKYPSIQIVYSHHGQWNRESAFSAAQKTLQKNQHIDAVFTYSEQMALGVLDAVDYARIKKPLVAAFDGTEEGISEIKRGRIEALVDQRGFATGNESVECALNLIQGKKMLPYMATSIAFVTRESINRPFQYDLCANLSASDCRF